MYEIVYRCEFIFEKKMFAARSKKGIDVFKNGFWITGGYKFTDNSNAKYWIPPHCIAYISKDRVSVLT